MLLELSIKKVSMNCTEVDFCTVFVVERLKTSNQRIIELPKKTHGIFPNLENPLTLLDYSMLRRDGNKT